MNAPRLYKNPQDGSTLRGLAMVNPVSWSGKPIPDRKWIVDELIPYGSVTMLTGDGGLGKSLLSLQLMTCCAIGKHWLGRQTAQIRAMGVFCEDDGDELHMRMNSVTTHYGCAWEDLGDMRVLSRVGFDNTLMEAKTVFEHGERREFLEETQFFHQIYNTAVEWGAQLVVLDSLHDLFAGNENDRRQARYFIGMLRRLALEIEGAVLINAHPSLSGMSNGSGMAGSTAWNNSVRSRLYLTRAKDDEENPEDTDRRVLKTMKANYGKAGGKIDLIWENGAFSVDQPDNGMVANIQARNDEKLFFEGLEFLRRQNCPSSTAPNVSSYLPRLLKSVPATKKFSVQKLRDIMVDLQARGLIARAQIGVGENRHPVYGFVPVTPKEASE